MSLPEGDRYSKSKSKLLAELTMAMGGRAAEEIIFSEITTGASNDLEKVTETAKQMVMRFGMSERLGPRVFGHDRGQPFLGREFSAESDYSEEIARDIDDEIRRIVEDAHQTARGILSEHRDELDRVSKILLERETIDADQFVKLLDGAAEEDVFTDEEPEPPAETPDEGEKVQRGTAQEGPRPITPPRPGLAAEMRAKDDE
jgi:cell division protease FtsH